MESNQIETEVMSPISPDKIHITIQSESPLEKNAKKPSKSKICSFQANENETTIQMAKDSYSYFFMVLMITGRILPIGIYFFIDSLVTMETKNKIINKIEEKFKQKKKKDHYKFSCYQRFSFWFILTISFIVANVIVLSLAAIFCFFLCIPGLFVPALQFICLFALTL